MQSMHQRSYFLTITNLRQTDAGRDLPSKFLHRNAHCLPAVLPLLAVVFVFFARFAVTVSNWTNCSATRAILCACVVMFVEEGQKQERGIFEVTFGNSKTAIELMLYRG